MTSGGGVPSGLSKAQVRRVRASSEEASELAEARERLTDSVREAKDLKDREMVALKMTERLRHQLGELHAGRSQLETKVIGLKARVTELPSELAAVAADRDCVRQQLAALVSREAQLRQIIAE